MRARDRLGRDASAAEHDAAPKPHIESHRREIFFRRVDAEAELADRVRAVGGDAFEAPRGALDGHRRVIRPRDHPIESAADHPAPDDRREVEIAVGAEVQQPAVDRRAHRTCETPARARDDRPGGELRTDRDPEHAQDVVGLETQTLRASDTDGGPERRPGCEDVARVHALADRDAFARAHRKIVIGGPLPVSPAHA